MSGRERERERECVCVRVYNLGKVGGLAHSVHATEGDDVRLPSLLGSQNIPQNVDSALWTEDLYQTLLHTSLHQTLNT